MNDVYVVHFEFNTNEAIVFGVFGLLILLVLFCINTTITWVALCIYGDRCGWRGKTDIFWLLFFTWPLYLLLVLIKMTLGGIAKLWSKI